MVYCEYGHYIDDLVALEGDIGSIHLLLPGD
jgi:hypothetical protein